MTATTLRLAFRCVTALFTAIITTRRLAITRRMSAFVLLFRVFHVTPAFQFDGSFLSHGPNQQLLKLMQSVRTPPSRYVQPHSCLCEEPHRRPPTCRRMRLDHQRRAFAG